MSQVDFTQHRDRFRRLTKMTTLFCWVGVIQAVILICLLMTPAVGKYFVTTRNGDVLPVQPLSAPMVTNTYLQTWAGKQVESAFSLNFVNYEDKLKALQPNFTATGWSHFQAALEQTNISQQMMKSKLTVSAVVQKTPVILQQGVLNGTYSWKVRVPLLVSFVSASAHLQRHFDVLMIIKRVPVMDAKHSIQIDLFST